MKMTKKGVSPLIATVLIIGFTVALAAMVMTWGSGFIKKTTEETEKSTAIALKCASELAFEISEVTCDSSQNIQSVKVDNRGTIDIKALKFRIVSAEQTTVDDKVELLEAFGARKYTSFKPNSNPTSVEAIATISVGAGKEDVICGQVVEKFTVSCPVTGA
ncbi:MAG: hypothetical protein Q8R00_01005 [Candidatus Nanoarchaeia archaeon]|nr:hypothetical protein [Candidatus Nanoarchaeia archaeon]